MINKENYELFAIDFIDGSLDLETRSEMIAFLHKHPAIKSEINELRDPILLESEPTIVFGNKESLKKEEQKKVLWITQIRNYAAAAIILLALGSIWIMNTDQLIDNKGKTATIEIEKPTINTTPKVANTDTTPSNKPLTIIESQNEITNNTPNTTEPKYQINSIKKKTPKTPSETKETVPFIPLLETNQELIASNNIELINTNTSNNEAVKIERNTANAERISSLNMNIEITEIDQQPSLPLLLMASVTPNEKTNKKKGQWLINALTQKSDGTKIFAFEGIKKALTPTRLRDANVDNASTNDSPIKQLTND